MSKFKKAIMGVTALVMAFSMTALAGCANGNDNKDPSDPNNPNGPGEGALVSPAKTDTVKVLERIQTQSFKAASMQYALDTKSMCTSYDSDEDGKILENATKQTAGEHNKTSGSAKINVKNYELDATSHYFEEALDAEGKKVANTERESYGYIFSRGGPRFNAYDDGKEITDFSKVTLSYDGAMELPAELKAMLDALPENGMPAQELTPLSSILNLAETYGGATFADKKLTINFNKTAYGLYNDVLAVIESLTEDTKVGDVIKAKPVKALIESLTYGVSAKDILDQVAAMAGGEAGASTLEGESEGDSSLAMIGAMLEILPEAAEGESVYAYLVKVLESKDVAEAIFKMIAPTLPASAVAPIAQFKVIELLQLIAASMQPPQNPDQGTTMSAVVYEESAGGMQQVTMAQIKKQIKDYLNQMVSVTEDKVTVTMPESAYEVSALEIVYTVGDDYAVSSVAVSGSVNEKTSYVYGNGHDGEYSYQNNEIENDYTISASIEFATSELALTDINNNSVGIVTYEYEDGTYYDVSECANISIYNEDFENHADDRTYIFIGAIMKDKQFSKVVAYTANADGTSKTAIEGCEWGGNTLSFNAHGAEGKIVCNLSIGEYHMQDGRGRIVINGTIVCAAAQGYYSKTQQIRIEIEKEAQVTTYKVAEIIAAK
ncbi:MAG: hypothetical protein K2N17_06265 [Clostridia bacterium]|nr:hypothetical protein [Clostridia bacterium]